MAVDFRRGAAASTRGLREIKLGHPAAFGCVMLTRMLQRPVDEEMPFTGEPIAVEEAARWGLVEVVPRDRLEDRARALGKRISAAAPLAVRKLKAIAREAATLSIAEALRRQAGPDIYSSEDPTKGLRAWRE